jgi:glycerophosphoryl diester phosphodiesterase
MNRFYYTGHGSSAGGRRAGFFSSSAPRVFAHRGGAGLAPENTLAAFDNGLALGADGLELDVHLSRDGLVVVHHDRTIERTTNERGPIAERTADELRRADAGYWFARGGAFPYRGCGLGVPTLAEVLARYRDVPIVIEMKANSLELAEAVVEVVRAAGAVDRVAVGSFGLRGLRALRQLEPAIATSASREEVRWAVYRLRCRWPVSRVPYGAYQVPERSGGQRVVSPRFVAAAHRLDLAVHVWTVDDEDDARRLLGWDVDGLITDRPDTIVPIARQWATRLERGKEEG